LIRSTCTAESAPEFVLLEAPFAGLFGVLLADEVLGWAGWVGCGVMLAGIVLAEPAAAATLRRLVPRTRAA
jgi:drug/metabolite transporter (DMT)-like permease